MGSAAREHQLSDSDDRWASRESALLLPLVSGCKVPKNGEDITLACLAKGPFLDSVRVTTGPESQAQMEKTTLKTLKILDHTQVSFLSIPWKPELHYCEAIMKDNKRKLHKAIHWPASWETATSMLTHAPSRTTPKPPGPHLSPQHTQAPSMARVSVPPTSHTQTQAQEPGCPADTILRGQFLGCRVGEERNHLRNTGKARPQANLQPHSGRPGSKEGRVCTRESGPPGVSKPPRQDLYPPTPSTTPRQECWNHTHPPSLYMLRPPLRGPWLQGEAAFTCLVVGDDLQKAHLSWEVAGAPPSEAVEEGPLQEHENGSQSWSSRLVLPISLWASGANITCTLSLPSMPSQVVSAAAREHAARAPSSLNVRALTMPRAASWFLCEVSGFSPPDILLTWIKDQIEVDPSWFATAPPMAQPGSGTFQTWSLLRVLAPQGPHLPTYTCVVRHEASRKLLNTSWSLDSGLAMTPPAPQSHDESSGDSMDLEDASGLWPTFAALFVLTLLYSGFVTFLKVK
ncbi:Immunoglobulin delta heavy chain [Vulpes lagopus]